MANPQQQENLTSPTNPMNNTPLDYTNSLNPLTTKQPTVPVQGQPSAASPVSTPTGTTQPTQPQSQSSQAGKSPSNNQQVTAAATAPTTKPKSAPLVNVRSLSPDQLNIGNPNISLSGPSSKPLTDLQQFNAQQKKYQATEAATRLKKNPPQTSSQQLQNWLNTQLAPFNSQLGQAVKQVQDYNYGKSWMPANIQGAIGRFQTMTGKALNGLVPATIKAEQQSVSADQMSTLLNLIPSQLIYHAIVSNLPGASNNPAVSKLWNIIQNINLQEPLSQNPNAALFGLAPSLNPNNLASGSGTGTGSGTGSGTGG